MLKVSRVLLAVLAALGMSSAIGQTGPVVGAFGTSVNGKTTTYDYKSTGNSDFARLTRGTYDPANNNSGFQALLQKKGYTPGGKEYPVAIAKQVPKAALAKAVSKTLPIVGNAIAMAELLGALFPGEGVHWENASGKWERSQTSERWYAYKETSDEMSGASATAVCGQVFGRVPWNGGAPYWAVVGITEGGATCKLFSSQDNLYANVNLSRVVLPPSDIEITEGDVQVKLLTQPTMPPAVDDLIIDIPPEALRVLAEETAAEPARPIAVTTDAVGTPQPSGITVPESVTTTTGTNSQGQPITTTTTTQTIVRPLEDGAIQHDEQTTTTTTTQTGTNPDGSPITTTTTSTTTTQSTPAPPVTGSTGTSTPPTQEIITCGLPDTPPCKIDETGTPQADPAKTQEEIDSIYGQIKTCLQDIKTCLPALPDLSWSFALPSGCSPLTFDTLVGTVIEIDMCQHQPTIHDLMSMLWAAAGLFGAVSLVARFSAGGA